MTRTASAVMLALLLAGCYPKVKVYVPVVDPCHVPLQAPPTTRASVWPHPTARP